MRARAHADFVAVVKAFGPQRIVKRRLIPPDVVISFCRAPYDTFLLHGSQVRCIRRFAEDVGYEGQIFVEIRLG